MQLSSYGKGRLSKVCQVRHEFTRVFIVSVKESHSGFCARRHKVLTISVRDSTMCGEVRATGAVFDYRFEGMRMCWRFSDIYTNLQLKMSPGTGAGWLQKRKSRLIGWFNALDLGATAFRMSCPYSRAQTEQSSHRVLPWVGLSSAGLLAMLFRSLFAKSAHTGMIESRDCRQKLFQWLRAALAPLAQDFDIPVCVDASVRRVGSEPFGRNCVILRVRAGVLSLTPLRDIWQNPEAISEDRRLVKKELGHLMQVDTGGWLEVLAQMTQIVTSAGVLVFKQCLWRIARLFDENYSLGFPEMVDGAHWCWAMEGGRDGSMVESAFEV